MKKQRGIIAQGWLYLIAAIALIGALAGLVKVWDNYTSGLIKNGYDSGKAATEAAYTNRDNKALQDKVDRIKFLEQQARDRERADAKRSAEIAAQRETDRRKYENQLATDLAAVRAGTLILRDPHGTTTCAGVSGGSAGGEAGRPTGERDGKAGTKLSGQVTADLFTLIDDADDVTRQLAQAQAVILQDRITCNGEVAKE